MKIGDYVRTKQGTIGKIKKFQKGQVIDIRVDNKHIFSDEYYDLMILDGGEYIMVNKEEYKHSPNIVDLIEVGDYVNGNYIEDIWRRPKNTELWYCDSMGSYLPSDIETIVTREQFERMEYEVK